MHGSEHPAAKKTYNIVAAGGQPGRLPFPAPDESSGIYMTPPDDFSGDSPVSGALQSLIC